MPGPMSLTGMTTFRDEELSFETTANLGATTPSLRAGWTGMLDGTSRAPTTSCTASGRVDLENQRGSRLTGRNEPDPVTSRLA